MHTKSFIGTFFVIIPPIKYPIMKKLPILFVISLIIASCSSDFESLTITYTKGTAIYGDLAQLRQVPLNSASKEIVDAGKVFISSELLLVGEEGEGIHIFDNSNPQNPVARSFMNIPGNREFYVEGDYLYAESLYDMLKIDLSNPAQPLLVARIENAIGQEISNFGGESLIGFELEVVTEKVSKDSDIYNHIYDGDSHVYYDYEENLIPPSAVPSSFAGNSSNAIGTVNRIAYLDEYLYVIGKSKLTIYDDSGDFTQVYNGYFGSNMETIYPMGDRLFVGTNNSVDIYSIADPANPQYESGFWHATSCDPVFPIDENTAYATLRTGEFATCPGDINALVVLDISRFGSVEEVQEIEMVSPYGLTAIGDKLYVGEGANGLKVFNNTNNRELELVKWDQSVKAYDVLAHPTLSHILLIAGPDGLSQYQIGQSSELQLLSRIDY